MGHAKNQIVRSDTARGGLPIALGMLALAGGVPHVAYDDGCTDPPGAQPVKPRETVGRNAPCPCGSGVKFKKCHGRAGT